MWQNFVASETAGLPAFDQGFTFNSNKNYRPNHLWPGEQAFLCRQIKPLKG